MGHGATDIAGRPAKLRQKAQPKTYEPPLGISAESGQKANQGASGEEAE
jgi:hypothetical protein